MKSIFGFVLMLIAVAFLQTSCVKGCIDDNALNYDPEATLSKGCIYPETVNIISVGLMSHSGTDNSGFDWDADGGPDKFIKIFNDESNALLYTTEIEEFLPVNWTVNPVVSLLLGNLTLRLELYDQDETEDVLMDVAVLDISRLTGTSLESTTDFYPESELIYGENGSGFTLSMNWTE